jgi:hypothetical protein
MGPHIPKDDFNDVWDSETDPARVWGTKEYFQRVDGDGWHTGKDTFVDQTRKIKADVDRIKRDAERISRDARKGLSHTHAVSGSFDWENILDEPHSSKRSTSVSPNSISRKKKKKRKRRFKLSKSSGGIGLGGILFWIVIALWVCSDDEADKTAKVKEVKPTKDITEQVKQSIDNLIPEAEALINKAKIEFDKITKEEKTKRPPKVADNSDQYSQEEDKYGSVEDKW